MPVPPDLELEIQSVADDLAATGKSEKKKNQLRELISGRKMQQIVFSTSFIWFATLVMYWGISYSMPKFGSTTHINFLILGVLEIVLVATVLYFLMQRVGRRKVCIGIMFTCAILNVFASIFRSTFSRQYLWENILLGLVATTSRASLSVFFGCMPMYCNELFPTNVRTLASGVSQIVGRVGNMVAPYVVLLEKDVWTPLPFLIYVVLGVAIIALIFYLPETLNKPLPELPEDLEKLWNTKESKQRVRYAPVTQEGPHRKQSVDTNGGNKQLSDVTTPIITDAKDD